MQALVNQLRTKGRAVINGKPVIMSMDEGVVKKQVQKALDGNIASIKLVLEALPPAVITFTIVVIDEEGNETVHPPQSDSISNDDRPEKPLGWFERLIRREVMKKVTITVDGEAKTVTILEAILLKLVIEARNGKDQAVRMLRKHFPDAYDEVISITPQFGTKVLKPVAGPVEDADLPPGQGLLLEEDPEGED